jgi:anti-sigma factor RsiW
LISYLDRTLTEEEMREVEVLIQTDNETNQQWQYLQLAVDAVEYAALYEQVANVKEQYNASLNVHGTPVEKAKVRTMTRVFQIAATLILLCITAAVYKYMTTSASDVFKEAYRPYDLNTSRSGGTVDALEQAYKNKNWQAVISAYNKLTEKNNKALFLSVWQT